MGFTSLHDEICSNGRVAINIYFGVYGNDIIMIMTCVQHVAMQFWYFAWNVYMWLFSVAVKDIAMGRAHV